MEIIRTTKLQLRIGERFEDGSWTPAENVYVTDGLILSKLTPEQHDTVLNISDNVSTNLSGFLVRLLGEIDGQGELISLIQMPVRGHIIIHGGNCYIVRRVVQDTTRPEIGILVERIRSLISY